MFLSVLLHLDVVSNRKSCSRLRFILQIATFFSGAEGIRTPDLRRAKSDLHCRGCSQAVRNACKTADLPLGAFISVRRCSPRLVYYWCKRTSGRSHSALQAILSHPAL